MARLLDDFSFELWNDLWVRREKRDPRDRFNEGDLVWIIKDDTQIPGIIKMHYGEYLDVLIGDELIMCQEHELREIE